MSSDNARRKAKVKEYARRIADCVRRGDYGPEHVVNRYARGGKGWHAFEQGLKESLGSIYVPPHGRLSTVTAAQVDAPQKVAKTSLLFVYGTLKKGYGNHARYLSSSRFVGDAVTLDAFAMSSGAIPFVCPARFVPNPIFHGHVRGEVYEVDRATRDATDRLEGHPDFYTRSAADVMLLSTNERIKAEMYLILRPLGSYLDRPDVTRRLEWRGA